MQRCECMSHTRKLFTTPITYTRFCALARRMIDPDAKFRIGELSLILY